MTKKDSAKAITLSKQNHLNLEGCGIIRHQEYPEHILEAIDLVSAVLRRIKEKKQNQSGIQHLGTLP